ncbi:hypothetical protein CASFOL_033590 [Castilleja foliolosa]|uniref:Uncharacterized protein n=1 Tax=Castilleja foliolosa TaxID=1961234 RepID=A0ABD3BYM2_9LAMI
MKGFSHNRMEMKLMQMQKISGELIIYGVQSQASNSGITVRCWLCTRGCLQQLWKGLHPPTGF